MIYLYSALIGLVFGIIYFYSMAWTLKKINSVKHPMRFFYLNLLARLALSTLVFYSVTKCYGVEGTIATLFAFLVIRTVFVRKITNVQGFEQKKKSVKKAPIKKTTAKKKVATKKPVKKTVTKKKTTTKAKKK